MTPVVRSLNITKRRIGGSWEGLTGFERLGPGGGVTPPSGTPADGLPFAISDMSGSPRKYYSLYFMPFSVSINNNASAVSPYTDENDYWFDKWLTGQELDGGTNWRPKGGYVRDRPFGRPARTGTEEQWRKADAADEVTQALAHHLDGFINNIFSTAAENSTNLNNWRYRLAREAANEHNAANSTAFEVLPLIDLDGSIANSTAGAIADLIAKYAYVTPVRGQTAGNTWLSTAPRLPDGRFVMAAYRPENKTVTWWQGVFNELQAQYGITVALWGIFLSWPAEVNYTSILWAACPWGDGADPVKPPNSASKAATVRSQGKAWGQPVWFGDERPYANTGANGVADESLGTAAGRGYLEQMISTAADVAWDVWSDTREGQPTRPGVRSGRCLGDLRLYWMIKWKTGNFPAILRDTIYLSHRDQLLSTPLGSFRSGQTLRMTQWNRGGSMSPATNLVECLTFLTAPADMTVNICGTIHTYTAPAGVNVATFTLSGTGAVSASAVRSAVTVASVTSPFPVKTTPFHDRWAYYQVSSARGVVPAEQYDLDATLY